MTQPAWAIAPTSDRTTAPAPMSTPTYLISPDDLPSIDECIATLAERDGKIDDAARVLHIDRVQLLRILADNPEAPNLLAQQLRLYTTLRTYEALTATGRTMLEKLDDMTAFELSRTFTNLSQSLAALTDKHETTQNVNITEVALRMLPPEARIALRELQAETDSAE